MNSAHTDLDPAREPETPGADMPSQGLLLDADEAHRRKTVRALRFHTVQLPILRLLGFGMLAALVWANQYFIQRLTHLDDVVRFLEIAGVYCLASWLGLLVFYRPRARFDLSLFFLVVDVPIASLVIYYTGANESLWFLIMLIRVADQTNTSFRRVLFFAVFTPLVYAALIAYVVLFEQREVHVLVEVLKVVSMLALNLYVSFTAKTAESIRRRMLDYLRLAKRSYRELKKYSEALNTSRKANELKSRTLIRQADALLVKNHELEEATVRAERARLEAVLADRAKGEFLANMNHEIRTPMNAILGFADLVLQTELRDDQREQLEEVQVSGRNLLELIDDVLHLSKVQAGNLEPEESEFVPVEHLDSIVAGMREHFVDGRVAFEFHASDLPDVVVSDPARLQQVLFNLIDNAAKFTEHGHVRVRAVGERIAGGRARLVYTVEDTGIGIRPEHRSRIFDVFTQGDASMTRQYGGTGLGLTIVKCFVELLSGTLQFESEVGKGTTFTVTIPVRVRQWDRATYEGGMRVIDSSETVHPEGPVRTVPSSSTNTTEVRKVIDALPAATSADERPEHPEPGAAAPTDVLVVEDNPVNQKLVSRMLETSGYSVDVANHGQEALDLLAERRYAIILMDMQMPVLDGYEATRTIKADSRLSPVPVIALTAHAMRGDREKCLDAGCDDYLTKPVRRAELIEIVQKYATAA